MFSVSTEECWVIADCLVVSKFKFHNHGLSHSVYLIFNHIHFLLHKNKSKTNSYKCCVKSFSFASQIRNSICLVWDSWGSLKYMLALVMLMQLTFAPDTWKIEFSIIVRDIKNLTAQSSKKKIIEIWRKRIPVWCEEPFSTNCRTKKFIWNISNYIQTTSKLWWVVSSSHCYSVFQTNRYPEKIHMISFFNTISALYRYSRRHMIWREKKKLPRGRHITWRFSLIFISPLAGWLKHLLVVSKREQIWLNEGT